MLLKRLGIMILVVVGILALLPRPALAEQSGPLVIVLTAKDAVTPTLAEYLQRGIRTAEAQKAAAVVVELDTPGGSLDSMQQIVQDFRASTVPVIVYVYPQGAMAGSAGTLITLAAHASAMAPGTAIGAASPVGPQGQDLTTTESTKIKNIMEALAESLTVQRGQAATDLAKQTIETASAASAQQAKQAGLIDFIAPDLNNLLSQLNGFQVMVNGSQVTLHVAGAHVEQVPVSFMEQMLIMLTDPNLVFLLLQLGVLAILIEISHPGGWVAGFIGVVCLALASYGLGILPVNWFGLVFLVTAFVLFILDIKTPTHGALTAAGAASLILGAMVLFNSPGTPAVFKVSPFLIVGTSLLIAALFAVIVSFAVRAQKVPVLTGREQMIGRIGKVQHDLHPQGTVHVNGELWTAQLVNGTECVPAGTRIQVVAVDGVKLLVRPLNGAQQPVEE